MNEKMTVASLIAAALGEGEGSNYVKFLETPPDRKMGDLAFPCFQLAKTLRKAPPMIAKDLCEKIESAGELPE